MIGEAIDKLKASRDNAFNSGKLGESNTFCEIIRLICLSGTHSARCIAVNVDKIIAYVEQGNYAHVTKDIKRLCNAAKRMK